MSENIQFDVGIITIREDEFMAVNHLLQNSRSWQPPESDWRIPHRPSYTVGLLGTAQLLINCVLVQVGGKGGRLAASHAARDLIEDCRPNLLLVVGICGLLPDDDATLGDVVLASRVYDFSIGAFTSKNGESARHSTDTGGPVHGSLQPFLGGLSSFQEKIRKFSPMTGEPPKISLKRANFVDSNDTAKISNLLKTRFSQAPVNNGATELAKVGATKIVSSPVNSGDNLVKDPKAVSWTTHARDAMAVEMELGGVYFIAHRANVPLLGIRGVSDVIGFKRDQAWTAYACCVAASAAQGILCTLCETYPKLFHTATSSPNLTRENFTVALDDMVREIRQVSHAQENWGATENTASKKVMNVAEACIFSARDWSKLSLGKQKRVIDEALWLSSQVTEGGLPSFTFAKPYQNTVHCTAVGLQALAEIKKRLPLDVQSKLSLSINTLAQALLSHFNFTCNGWRTVLCSIDRDASEIRLIPTLMAIRGLRIAGIENESSHCALQEMVKHANAGLKLGCKTGSYHESLATTLFLASEAAACGLLIEGVLKSKADKYLKLISSDSLTRWAETEQVSIAEYGDIERVPFTHWALTYAIDYSISVANCFDESKEMYENQFQQICSRVKAEFGNDPLSLASKVLDHPADQRFLYPLFLIGASASSPRN